TLRRLFGEAKVKRAVELAVQGIKDGHKVVIWYWHQDVANKLYEVCQSLSLPVLSIEESMSQDTRETNRQIFQSMHEPTIMLIGLAVGGVAISLDTADLNIFCELDWIPATLYQASMRVFSPTRPHANVFLFCDTPVERRLVEVLQCNEACQSAVGL